jgi:hypothetical protein
MFRIPSAIEGTSSSPACSVARDPSRAATGHITIKILKQPKNFKKMNPAGEAASFCPVSFMIYGVYECQGISGEIPGIPYPGRGSMDR